jgi:penicillin-binding protein 1A
MGFSPDLVAGVYVGFDNPRTLGPRAFGSNTAGPIWKQFMENALEGEPQVPFRIPSGIKMVRMNLDTGQPARPGDDNVILEAFKTGNSPSQDRRVIGQGQTAANDKAAGGQDGGSGGGGGTAPSADSGTGGGLY